MKILDFFTAKPARFFLWAAIIWGGIMCFLNEKDGANFAWHDLLVEANGMVFDLLVFGILLSSYEALREKRSKIERLHEEIDDYRGWDEKEATYRIVGIIRRLNKLGVSEIQLYNCFLQQANLGGADLSGSDLSGADLSGARLISINLSNASLHKANLSHANLWQATLKGTDLSESTLVEANLWQANLSEASLWQANLADANLEASSLGKAYLQDAVLLGAQIQKAWVSQDWLEKIKDWGVIGHETIKEKYLITKNGQILLK